MVRFLLRILWRILIFMLGIGSLWLTVQLFLYAHARLPVFIVLLVIYCFLAYGVIPLLVRLWRVIIKPDHIPLYVTTGDGWPSDPVNIALVAKSRNHLERTMHHAGWYTADKMGFKTGFLEALSVLLNRSYPSAPLSSLYLFNRRQDIGFEIPTNPALSARTRHHVRFWRLEEPPLKNNAKQYLFWVKKLRHLLHLEKEIWIGAATEETHPIAVQWFSGQLTHGGSHDSDSERDFIIASLKESKKVKIVSFLKPGEKIRFRGQQLRTFYITDGALPVITLR